VIDPRRAFGKPVVAESGTPTEVIYNDFLLMGDAAEVADEYGIATAQAKAAIGFELELNNRTLH
jgi:uncharacterized protein (DUF433 family)